MDDGKYIIIDVGFELAVMFNPILSHREMAGQRKIVAAGFFRVGSDCDVVAYGESVSLGGIKSRPEDAAILEKVLYGS